MNLNGIIPALITPFDDKNQIDHGALKEHIDCLISQGVGGFYACGSTAECFLMTEEERKAVLETIIKAVDGRVPVVAHIGAIGTDKSVDLARHAKEAGASYVSSVPPFYYKFSYDDIATYYSDIAKAADLPLIIYSIPAFSGVEITADNLQKILDVSGAAGIKYTSYNLFELEKIARRFPKLNIFYGHDELFCNSLPIGINGAIGSTFNVMAPRFIALKKAYESGDLATAEKLQGEANTIIEAMIRHGVNQSIKYILTKRGIPCGDCRRPFAKLSEDGKAELDSMLDKI